MILRPDIELAQKIAKTIFDGSSVIDLEKIHPDDLPELVYIEERKALLFSKGQIARIDVKAVPMTSDLLFSTTELKGETGATLIISKTGGGKTILSEHFLNLELDKGKTVAFASMAEATAPLVGSLDQIIAVVYSAKLAGAETIVIDSLRNVINSASGALRAGGLSRGIETAFTAIERMARYFDISIIATVNPSAAEPSKEMEAVDQMYHMAHSSVERSIKIKETDVANDIIFLTTEEHLRSKGRLNTTSSYNVPVQGIGSTAQAGDRVVVDSETFATLGGLSIIERN